MKVTRNSRNRKEADRLKNQQRDLKKNYCDVIRVVQVIK